jgi:hypothetical protein
MSQVRNTSRKRRYQLPGATPLQNPKFHTVGFQIHMLIVALGTLYFEVRDYGLGFHWAFIWLFANLFVLPVWMGSLQWCLDQGLNKVLAAAQRSSALAQERIDLVRLAQRNFRNMVGNATYLCWMPWNRNPENSVELIDSAMENLINQLTLQERYEELEAKVSDGTATRSERNEYATLKGNAQVTLRRIGEELGELAKSKLAEQVYEYKRVPMSLAITVVIFCLCLPWHWLL